MVSLNQNFETLDVGQFDSIENAWGAEPTARYKTLAAHFRPLFARIKTASWQREQQHILPFEQLQWLKDSGFTRLRLPEQEGGFSATLPELFQLLIELADADSHLPQILRVHFGFTEDLLITQNHAFKQKWTERVAQGQTIGSAWTEGGAQQQSSFQTHLYLDDQQRLRLQGEKYYTTGSLYADWIDVGITDLAGQSASVLVARQAQGVTVLDDWNGFGQQLTASGSAYFDQVEVDAEDVLPDDVRYKYSAAFYQLVQLAIITGLGRSLTRHVSQAVAARSRNYSHANAAQVKHDPQILQVVGQIHSATYAAHAIVAKTAASLERAHLAAFSQDAEFEQQQNIWAELESAQAQSVITHLLLDAATNAFDALGASATDKDIGFDRYWRNIRTLASHNPRIFKDRIVGDFSVNGTLPPYQWRIGTPDLAENRSSNEHHTD